MVLKWKQPIDVFFGVKISNKKKANKDEHEYRSMQPN